MIIRPRLNDYHNIQLRQADVDFAIPFINEDIPLYVDPFLLWKSPSQQDNALHTVIINSFNFLGDLSITDLASAVEILKELSECDEVGLGNSKTKHGKKIGNSMAQAILSTFKDIPQVRKSGFSHFEELQLLVENFSKDRISDITCNLVKSFLIDYTIQQCEELNIPTELVEIKYFENKSLKFEIETNKLPVHPESKDPILLVPKRWLRYMPWINFDSYFDEYLKKSKKLLSGRKISRVELLEYNRKNYGQVEEYVKRRRLRQKDCNNDPLFSQIPVLSSKRKLKTILDLPTGKTDNADRDYEENACQLLASILFPDLDFAQSQARTIRGVHIRDLIFYNNSSHKFLKEIHEKFSSKQVVFELKNVKEVTNTHINQLNRYLSGGMGDFGIIMARNKPQKKVLKNTIDLWAGQRKCILILDDDDLKLMCEIYSNKQRKPIDVINKKYVEFVRLCPS